MADSLIARLSTARGVVVRPIGAVRRYTAADTDSLRAARELGVDWVLEGSVQQTGQRAHVTARLLEVSSGAAAWSGNFDETFTHVFDVQETISRRVAEVVIPHLTERERGQMAGAGTGNTDAYRLYLEARYQTLLYTPDAFRRAIVLYRQAIAADPRYVYAHVGLADVLRRTQFTSNTAPRDTFEAVRAAAQRAIELDPQLGDAHAMLGSVAYWYEWDWPRAEQTMRRARELNPSSVDAHYGLAHVLMTTGPAGRGAAAVHPRARDRSALAAGQLLRRWHAGDERACGRRDRQDRTCDRHRPGLLDLAPVPRQRADQQRTDRRRAGGDAASGWNSRGAAPGPAACLAMRWLRPAAPSRRKACCWSCSRAAAAASSRPR
jgi:hypothetical protein